MEQTDNPVAHLLWCVLVALRTATENHQITSETRKRKYIAEWLSGARRVGTFRGLTREFATLRQLLAQDKRIPIDITLTRLWESAVAYEGCDIFRFRHALDVLREQGWGYALCPWPERIIPEMLGKGQRRNNHILQLTRMEEAFTPAGAHSAPVALLLLLNNPDNERVEHTFYDAGFTVVRGGDTSMTLKTPRLRHRLVRTLYIGHSGLPEEKWGPRAEATWMPSRRTTHTAAEEQERVHA